MDAPVTDPLPLECMTISAGKSPFPDRDVYLVIKRGNFEIPVDPSRRVTANVGHGSHVYAFLATDPDSQFSISIPFPRNTAASKPQSYPYPVVSGYSEDRDGQYIPYHLDQKIDSAPRVMYMSYRYETKDLPAYPRRKSGEQVLTSS